jgi:beta-1,4-mannosyl-glycoprotein beta-1,4-N-acetylglucosaminyltransferase
VIIDAFIFSDEVDLLDLRLGQLNDVVDIFCIVESSKSFQSAPKPLHYKENLKRFEKYANKIRYLPLNLDHVGGGWAVENAQREGIVNLIRDIGAPSDSTLTFSDLDEIPNPEIISQYRPEMGLMNLKQYTFFYTFNHLFNYGRREWSRARIGRVKDILDYGAGGFRGGYQNRDLDHTFPSLENGGWHCSYFGSSIERIRLKVNSFAHDDVAPFINGRTDKQIIEDMHRGTHLFHFEGINQAEIIDCNDTVRTPPYFRANQEHFCMFTDAFLVNKYRHLIDNPETGQISSVSTVALPVPEYAKVDKTRIKRF